MRVAARGAQVRPDWLFRDRRLRAGGRPVPFQDLSDETIQDDAFQRLLTYPNVLVTGHQAFFTQEALTAIADTTLANIAAFERGDAWRTP